MLEPNDPADSPPIAPDVTDVASDAAIPRKARTASARKASAATDGAAPTKAVRPRKAAKKQPDSAAAEAEASPRKRAAKKSPRKPAAMAEPVTTAVPATAAPDQSPHSPPTLAAPGVLFVAPAEAPVAPAPRRRRSATTAAAELPRAEVETTPVAPVAGVDVEDVEEPEEVREAAAEEASVARRRRRRGRRGRGRARDAAEPGIDETVESQPDDDDDADAAVAVAEATSEAPDDTAETPSARRRRRRRRRVADAAEDVTQPDDPPNTVVHVRETAREQGDGVRGVKGSTRLEAKRQRRRGGRETSRRRPPILTEAEFLARREAVDRVMAVRQRGDRTQIAVLEDGVLVEHYVTRASTTSYVGNIYLGRVQNVLPSMEAAFVDIGKGRNGVLYAGEVNWDAAGLEGKARAIESALSPGDTVLVQVTKDPIAHKGARLTSQVSLPGRFLVYVPGGAMTGISRKLPDNERHRLKEILKKIVPEDAGVIVRTAAEGASEDDLTRDVERLKAQWETISAKAAQPKSAPSLVYGEPDLAIRVVRDVFNEDFGTLVVQGDDAWRTISGYLSDVAPDLAERASLHTGESDLFHDLRIDEQLTKALDRKVWLPSGGSIVIDRTEAMMVIDVNTGKFVGSGGNLEQTVTRNNLEAAEEIVRQLRLRDVGGIIVIDFIDMVLESNRELVLRRLTEGLGRDRTKHQVAEVTSLGLVQMTRKRVGEGLLEAFSETCPTCNGRGVLIHSEPVDRKDAEAGADGTAGRKTGKAKRGRKSVEPVEPPEPPEPLASEEQRRAAASAMAVIAATPHDEADEQTARGVEPTPAEADEQPVAEAEVMPAEPTEPSAAEATEPMPAEPTEQEPPTVTLTGSPVLAQPAIETPDVEPTQRPRRRRAASRPAGPPVLTAGS